MNTERIVKCPTCATPVRWAADNPFRPFCSARCKQIDLGAWASESYRVPASAPPDEVAGEAPSASREKD